MISAEFGYGNHSEPTFPAGESMPRVYNRSSSLRMTVICRRPRIRSGLGRGEGFPERGRRGSAHRDDSIRVLWGSRGGRGLSGVPVADDFGDRAHLLTGIRAEKKGLLKR